MLRVVIVYFRSGGTLLNRCLASIPNVVMMSEVGPLKNQVAEQAKNWYGITLKSSTFVDSVRELNQICEETSRHLVVRLWVVGEFASGRRDSPAPTYRLSGYHALRETFDEVRAIALLRDPIDIWISRGCRSEGFFRNYRRYVENVLADQIPVFHYEQLCRDPDGTMRLICERLSLPFDERYNEFHAWTNVRGDTNYETSRGRELKHIKRLKRRRIPRRFRNAINASQDMIAVNSALGYPVSYEGADRESWLVDIYRRCRSRLNRQ